MSFRRGRAQLTGCVHAPIVARMSGPEKDSKKDDFDRELRRLEARIEDLLETCRQLKDENRSLRQRQENLVGERAALLQKNEQARANSIDDRTPQSDGALSMSDDTARVSVRLLDKEYQVACSAAERADLIQSAELLNRRMREIRDSGKVVGLDRIAVMAALNLANELQKSRSVQSDFVNAASERLRALRQRIESSAEGGHQLEL
jgi:cell division protein ZapA